jgi:hydrogenase nickel incorporation protein HypA/HybF
MHELSIISSVVESVIDSLEKYPGARVVEVRLKVGALAAVVEDSLQFCYGIATQDTPLEGSRTSSGPGLRPRKLVPKVCYRSSCCSRCRNQ